MINLADNPRMNNLIFTLYLLVLFLLSSCAHYGKHSAIIPADNDTASISKEHLRPSYLLDIDNMTVNADSNPNQKTSASIQNNNSSSKPINTLCEKTSDRNSLLKCYVEYSKKNLDNYSAKYGMRNIKKTNDGEFTINFQSVDIKEVVDIILGDLLDLNYTISPKVEGQVSFSTSKPIKQTALLNTLDMILTLHNASLIVTNDIYTVTSSENASAIIESPSIWSKASNLPPGLSTTIVPIKFITADSLQQLLDPFKPSTVKTQVDPINNSIMLTGTQSELIRMVKMIDIFDTNQFAGQTVAIYIPENIDSNTILKELKLILDKEISSNIGKLIRILPLERINAIIVMGPQSDYIKHIGDWIERLDQSTKEFGPKLYVYNVQSGVASKLAKILNGLFFDLPSDNTNELIEPGARPSTISSVNTDGSTNTTTNNNNSESSQNTPTTIISRKNSLRIVPDDVNNSLLIYATPNEYKNIKSAIIKLDRQPLQVLIEASFLEVTLNDNMRYGVQWFFKGSFNNLSETGVLNSGEASALTPQLPGFVYSLIDSTNRVRGLIEALDSQTTLNLISSPSLFVLNNHTASIQVGDEVPVVTRSSVNLISSDAPTINEIEFRDTGVLLSVTPRVNSSGLVNVAIEQEVSSAVKTTTSGIDTPTIQQRKISTTVAINDGETIVLGGLIREENSNNSAGIPGLHKIPLVGTLFGRKEKSNHRTELLVLITPHVIQSNDEAQEISNILNRNMHHLNPVVLNRSNYHHEPPH